MPLLTVFTPAFNLENYIAETITSILNQTFQDFEYLIIDDCSNDATVQIIESFKDPRIKLIKNNSNQGISYNRNLAIEKAKGIYLAMIDGDDLALPDRLQEQVEFLQKNKDYGILGTEVININENGDPINGVVKYKIPDNEIPSRMLFNNYIATSSAMIRLSSLGDIRFKKEYIVAEDYEVWIRLIRNSKIGHIRKPLTKYRIHSTSISIQKKQLMLDTEKLILQNQLKELQCELNSDEFQVFLDLSQDNQFPYYEKFHEINKTISKLFNANINSRLFNLEAFRSLLFRYWYIFYLNISSYSPTQLKEIKQSGMYKLLSSQEKLKLSLKSLIKKNNGE